jgi:hypothetical protein
MLDGQKCPCKQTGTYPAGDKTVNSQATKSVCCYFRIRQTVSSQTKRSISPRDRQDSTLTNRKERIMLDG